MRELEDKGLWVERLNAARFDGRPALFLDRDGVLVEEVHFLRRAEDVRLTDGAADAIAAANQAGAATVIVTNQSGIARGHYGWPEFAVVQAAIVSQLRALGAGLDLVLACGYHPDGVGELAREHEWRKPGPGMLLTARALLGVSLQDSLIVGDRMSDIAAGRAAGVGATALVETGYGQGQWDQLDAARGEGRPARAANAAAAINAWLAGIA